MFQSQRVKHIHLIKVPSDVDKITLRLMDAQLDTWVKMDVALHVFDFKEVKTLAPEGYRSFAKFKQAIAKSPTQSIAINVGIKLMRQMSADGVTQVFNPVANFIDYCRTHGIVISTQPAVNPEAPALLPIFTAFSAALTNSLVNVGVKPGARYVRVEHYSFENGVMGQFQLELKSGSRTVSLVFSKDSAVGIYNKLVGAALKDINADVEDQMMHFLTALWNASKALDVKNPNAELFPEVFAGNLKVVVQNKNGTVVMPFQTACGDFFLELTA
ncbi:MAG: hypothetical protein NDI61_05215 [Bdellovibrionaceae bacterium]|nr:hypothetical protein [Pseudobdellovibrionaceae bacterium]